LASPYDEAAILTIDARGEYETIGIFHGRGNSIKKLRSVKYPHSIGYLYTMVTEYLGFRPQSDEYKVMGLAAYGTPVLQEVLRAGKRGRTEFVQTRSKLLQPPLHVEQGAQKYSPKFVEYFGRRVQG
jgi:carbamoyltransferase